MRVCHASSFGRWEFFPVRLKPVLINIAFIGKHYTRVRHTLQKNTAHGRTPCGLPTNTAQEGNGSVFLSKDAMPSHHCAQAFG